MIKQRTHLTDQEDSSASSVRLLSELNEAAESVQEPYSWRPSMPLKDLKLVTQ